MFTEIHSPCLYWKKKTEVLLIAERLSPSFPFTVLLTTLSLHNQICTCKCISDKKCELHCWSALFPSWANDCNVFARAAMSVPLLDGHWFLLLYISHSLSHCLSLFLSQKSTVLLVTDGTNTWESVSQFFVVFFTLYFVIKRISCLKRMRIKEDESPSKDSLCFYR